MFYRLIHCTWVYPLDEFSPFFGYYFFNVMLLVLQILHLYWAALISRMVYKLIFSKVYIHLYVGHKCMKSMLILQITCLVASLWFTLIFFPLLCGLPSSCSWKVTTGAMKRRMTVTHRRKETTNWITLMALEPEAGPTEKKENRQHGQIQSGLQL